jgi:hypothetical protein
MRLQRELSHAGTMMSTAKGEPKRHECRGPFRVKYLTGGGIVVFSLRSAGREGGLKNSGRENILTL